MTICYLCTGEVRVDRLIEHWRTTCPETRPVMGIVRRIEGFARAVAEPEPQLLSTVWEQIEDIMVEQGFVR